jgi:hypothetical protein
MSHVYKGMNKEATGHRVKKGKLNEAAVAACLNKHHGFHLKESPPHEDMGPKKRDFYQKVGEKTEHHQIKSRASGRDILYDRYEPYYRWDHPDNKDGRDHVGKFEKFDCLGLDGETIRVVDAKRMREIVADLDQEWADHGHPDVFRSQKHQGAEYRKHIDKYSGVPKMLCFLPASIFSKEKGEIEFYEMIWED